MITNIQAPLFAYTKSGVKLQGTTTKHLLTDYNDLAYQLLVNALPLNGQRLQINWFGGSQTFVYTNTNDQSGNTIGIVAVTTAQAANNLLAAINSNYELSRDFIASVAGNVVSLKPLEVEQELFLEIGSGTTANISKGASTPVRREYNENLFISCKVLTAKTAAFVAIIDQIEEQYKPVKGIFEIDMGKFAESSTSYFIPTLTNPLPTADFTPVNNSLAVVRLILSEYDAQLNENFQNSVREMIYYKGGLASHLNESFLQFDTPQSRSRMLSNFPTKRVTPTQLDWIFTHHLENGGDMFASKTVEAFFTNENSITYNLITDVELTQNTPLFTLGGYVGADIVNNLTPEDIALLWKFIIYITVNDGPDPIVLQREYILEDAHYLDRQFVFVNSFGVPELITFRGELEMGIETKSEDFVKSNPNSVPLQIGQIDQYDQYYINKYELSTGLIPATEMVAVSDFLQSPEVYLIEENGDFRKVLVKPGSFQLSNSLGEMQTIKIALSGAKKERGY